MPPVRYIDWPEMEHKAVPPEYRQHEMTVRNGRPLRDTFKLDTHGFVFVDHHTQVKDFTDEAERKRVYDPEVQALIRKHSGAVAKSWCSTTPSASATRRCSRRPARGRR